MINCENGHKESKRGDVRKDKVWGKVTLGKVVWERLSKEVTFQLRLEDEKGPGMSILGTRKPLACS